MSDEEMGHKECRLVGVENGVELIHWKRTGNKTHEIVKSVFDNKKELFGELRTLLHIKDEP